MAGRKSKYESHVAPYLERITQWCRSGATEAEICKKLHVGVSTLQVYKGQFPALLEALRVSKDVADDNVEASLYNRAIGMEVKETTVHVFADSDNKTRKYQKTVTKQLPPETSAAFIWLKNRRPAKWRDRQEIGIDGSLGELMKEEQNL